VKNVSIFLVKSLPRTISLTLGNSYPKFSKIGPKLPTLKFSNIWLLSYDALSTYMAFKSFSFSDDFFTNF